jgi:hypothetical protein
MRADLGVRVLRVVDELVLWPIADSPSSSTVFHPAVPPTDTRQSGELELRVWRGGDDVAPLVSVLSRVEAQQAVLDDPARAAGAVRL